MRRCGLLSLLLFPLLCLKKETFETNGSSLDFRSFGVCLKGFVKSDMYWLASFNR